MDAAAQRYLIANAKEEEEEEEEEEAIYLPLMPGWKESKGQAAKAPAAVAAAEDPKDAAGEDDGKGKRKEVPIMLFKFLTTDDTTPADLSFCSVVPGERECVYGLGTFCEMGKVYAEYMRIEQTGDDVQFKTSEITPVLGRNHTTKKKGAEAA